MIMSAARHIVVAISDQIITPVTRGLFQVQKPIAVKSSPEIT